MVNGKKRIGGGKSKIRRKKRGDRTCDERDDNKGGRDVSKSYYTQHPMQSINRRMLNNCRYIER
jgi:hypothetical protein